MEKKARKKKTFNKLSFNCWGINRPLTPFKCLPVLKLSDEKGEDATCLDILSD